jgi:GT2 family glycosyltransferase
MIAADAAAWPTQPDYLLWLNDDVQLASDAIRTLCETSLAAGDTAIVVGAMKHPETGRVIYGGHVRRGGRRSLALNCVEPTGSPLAVDTINGNAVLMPRVVRELVGTLDGQFTHAMADMDYGFRAVGLGVPVLLAAKFVGTCAPNERKGRWRDPQLGLRVRWRELTSFLGLPPKEWLAYTRRHAGWQWPRWFFGPYIHCILIGVRPRGARGA